MADFSDGVQDVIAQPMAPVRPVYNNATASGIENIGSALANGFAGFRQQAAFNREIALKNRVSSVQADYSQQLLKIADAVDQGQMSSMRAKMNARNLFYQFVGNHPEMTDALLQTHKSVMADAGLGSDISTGTEAEQLQRKMRQDAAGAGFVKPGATLEEANQGMAMYQQYQMSGAMLSQAQKNLDFQRSLVGQQKDYVDLAAAKQNFVTGGINQNIARLDLAQKGMQVQSQQAIASGAQALQWKLNQDLQGIDQQLQQGKITPQQAQLAAQQHFAAIQSTASQVAPAANADYMNNVMAPMKTLLGSYVDKFSGKIDATTNENQINSAMAHQQVLMVNSSPLFAKVAASSKLFPAVVQPFQAQLTDMVINNMGMGNGSVPGVPNTVAGTPDNQTYLNVMKNALAQHAQGTLDPGAAQELHQNLHNILSGTKVYGPTADDPTKLNDVMQFFASPEFGKYMSSTANTANLDDNDRTQVQNLVRDNYERVVIPMVADKFKNSQVQNGYKWDPNSNTGMMGADEPNMQPTPSQVHPEFNGAGVSFVPNDMTNSDARSKANDLNQSTAPVMNTLIRASANLEGTRDYRKAYDTILGQVNTQLGLKSGSASQAQPDTSSVAGNDAPNNSSGVQLNGS